MKKFVFFIIFTSITLMAQGSEFMEFGAKDFKSKKMNKSKWVFDLGASQINYPTKFPNEFKGAYDTVKKEHDYESYGIQLGFGGELNLGAGISSTLKLGGFYSKNLNSVKAQASEDIDLDLASTSLSHVVYGGEASLSLNYLFETKSLGIQPFIEFGVGSGVTDIKRTYDYKGLSGSSYPDPEYYEMNIDEKFDFSRMSVGVNFISARGLVSYFKASRLAMVVSERKYEGKIQSATDTDKVPYSDKLTDLTDSFDMLMGSVGLGFRF